MIPVLPGGELEVLLEHSIDLCRRGVDTQSEPCQRFFRDGLTISFTKIMTDEAVSSWRLKTNTWLTLFYVFIPGSTYISAFSRIASEWLNW